MISSAKFVTGLFVFLLVFSSISFASAFGLSDIGDWFSSLFGGKTSTGYVASSGGSGSTSSGGSGSSGSTSSSSSGYYKFYVVDSSTNAKMASATVTLTGSEGTYTASVVGTSGGGTYDGTYYVFSAIPVGSYSVTISANGYTSQTQNVDVVTNTQSGVAIYLVSTSSGSGSGTGSGTTTGTTTGSGSGTVSGSGSGQVSTGSIGFYVLAAVSGSGSGSGGITGAVVGGSEYISGASVKLQGSGGTYVSTLNGNRHVFSEIPVGTYTATASAEGHSSSSRSVSVGAGVNADITFSLKRSSVGGAYCYDSDATSKDPNGKNPLLNGTVTSSSGTFKDSCFNEGNVKEYYCDAGINDYDFLYMPCPSGTTCKGNGMCVGSGVEKDRCFEASSSFKLSVASQAAQASTLFFREEGKELKLNDEIVIYSPYINDKGQILKLTSLPSATSALDNVVFKDVLTNEEFKFNTGVINEASSYIDGHIFYVKVVTPGSSGSVVLTWGDGASYGNVGSVKDVFKCAVNIGTETCSNDVVSLSTSFQSLKAGDSLSSIRNVLTKNDLPTLLEDGSVTDAAGNVYKYTQKFEMGSSQIKENGIAVGSDPANGPLITYSLTFAKPLDILDTVNVLGYVQVKILGKEYIVGRGLNDGLYLYGGGKKVGLDGGETKTVANGVAGESIVNLKDTTSSTSAVIYVDGVLKSVVQGQVYKFPGGVEVYIKDIYHATKTGTLSHIDLIVGVQTLHFVDNSAVREGVDEVSVPGTLALISKDGRKLTRLEIRQTSRDSQSAVIPVGGSLVDRIFGSFKITYAGISTDKSHNIFVGGMCSSVPSGGGGGGSTSSDRCKEASSSFKLSVASQAAQASTLFFREEGSWAHLNDYLVIYSPNHKDKGRILKLTSIPLGTSATDSVVFKDVLTNEEFKFNTGLLNEGSVNIDGYTFYVKSHPSVSGGLAAFVILTWGDGASYGKVGSVKDVFSCGVSVGGETVSCSYASQVVREDGPAIISRVNGLAYTVSVESVGGDGTLKLAVVPAGQSIIHTPALKAGSSYSISGSNHVLYVLEVGVGTDKLTSTSFAILDASCSTPLGTGVGGGGGGGSTETSNVCRSNECGYKGNCLTMGTRKDGLYCSISGVMIDQKATGDICDNSWECGSNACIDGKCITMTLWQKFLSWFFGGNTQKAELFPTTISGYALDKDSVKENKELCYKAENTPDFEGLGLTGEYCTKTTHALYDKKDSSDELLEGIEVSLIEITKGESIIEAFISSVGKPKGDVDFFRIEDPELTWFTKDAKYEMIMTVELGIYGTTLEGLANTEHPVVGAFKRKFGADNERMRKVAGKSTNPSTGGVSEESKPGVRKSTVTPEIRKAVAETVTVSSPDKVYTGKRTTKTDGSYDVVKLVLPNVTLETGASIDMTDVGYARSYQVLLCGKIFNVYRIITTDSSTGRVNGVQFDVNGERIGPLRDGAIVKTKEGMTIDLYSFYLVTSDPTKKNGYVNLQYAFKCSSTSGSGSGNN